MRFKIDQVHCRGLHQATGLSSRLQSCFLSARVQAQLSMLSLAIAAYLRFR